MSSDTSSDDEDLMAQFEAHAQMTESALQNAKQKVVQQEKEEDERNAAIVADVAAASAEGGGDGGASTAAAATVVPPTLAERRAERAERERGNDRAAIEAAAALKAAERENDTLKIEMETLRDVFQQQQEESRVEQHERSSELEQKSVKIAQQEHELEQQRGEIDTLQAKLGKHKETLSGQGREAIELHSQLTAQTEVLRERDAQLKQAKEVQRQLEAAAAARAPSQSERSDGDLAASASAAEAERQAQVAATTALEAELAQARAEVAELETAVAAEKDASWSTAKEVKKLKAQLKKSTAQSGDLESRLAEAEAASDAASDAARTSEAERVDLEATLGELRHQLMDARAAVEEHAARSDGAAVPPSPGESLGSLDAELQQMHADEEHEQERQQLLDALSAQRSEMEAEFSAERDALAEQLRESHDAAASASASASSKKDVKKANAAASKAKAAAKALAERVEALEGQLVEAEAKSVAATEAESEDVRELKRRMAALAKDAQAAQAKRARAEKKLESADTHNGELTEALREATERAEKHALEVARLESSAGHHAAATLSVDSDHPAVAAHVEEATRAVDEKLFAAKQRAQKMEKKLVKEREARKAAEAALDELQASHSDLASIAGDHERSARTMRKRNQTAIAERRVVNKQLAAITAERDALLDKVQELARRLETAAKASLRAQQRRNGGGGQRVQKSKPATKSVAAAKRKGGGGGRGTKKRAASTRREKWHSSLAMKNVTAAAHTNVREQERLELEMFEKRMGKEKCVCVCVLGVRSLPPSRYALRCSPAALSLLSRCSLAAPPHPSPLHKQTGGCESCCKPSCGMNAWNKQLRSGVAMDGGRVARSIVVQSSMVRSA